MIESRIYRFKQRFFSARLVQKSHRTGRERSRPGIVVCVRRDENDRNLRVGGSQLTLKIQSTHAWHPHIKNQAIRIVQFDSNSGTRQPKRNRACAFQRIATSCLASS